MKRFQFLVLLVFLLGLTSCFIADDAFGTPKQPKLSLKQKTQSEISNYIKGKSEGYGYYKYGFSDLIIHKPQKMILLDSLKDEQTAQKNGQIELDQTILELEREIEQKGLKYTLEMDHVFSLTDKSTGGVELYESRFFLTDSLSVFEVDLLMNISMDDDQESIFADYFYETTIFLSGDYAQSKRLSKNFYSFFKSHQDELNSIKEKSNFLTHTLWLCQEVKNSGYFNQSAVLEKTTVNRLRLTEELIDYESLKFSVLYEINEDENLKGYYFFHKFSHLNNFGEEELSVVYVSFSPYYELIEILQVEKPYNQYFDE